MPALTINGVELSLKAEAGDLTSESIGQSDRTQNGQIIRDDRGEKRNLKIETTLMPLPMALAWILLLRGRHETWDFNTNTDPEWRFSSSGHRDNLMISASRSTITPWAGAGNLYMHTGAAQVRWQVYLEGDWTVFFRYRVDGSSTWIHYAETSEGGIYEDGVPAATYDWVTVTSQELRLLNPSPDHIYIDDLVLIRGVLPQELIQDFANVASPRPWSSPVEVDGDLAGGARWNAQADAKMNGRFVSGHYAGDWRTDLISLVVDLMEE